MRFANVLNNRSWITHNFAGHQLHLHGSGVCYWPERKTLIVSDLHLEKGSYLALQGQPIPLGDTRYTLERLQQVIVDLKPETVICLGDNIHDANGFLRMSTQDSSLLQSLCERVDHWQWVIGNHDPVNLQSFFLKKMEFTSEFIIDNVCFTHELQKDKPIQIIGHYHPKMCIRKQGARITGKCFSVSSHLLIMPAFGSYTGGLDISNKVYKDIFTETTRHYLLFKESIFLALQNKPNS